MSVLSFYLLLWAPKVFEPIIGIRSLSHLDVEGAFVKACQLRECRFCEVNVVRSRGAARTCVNFPNEYAFTRSIADYTSNWVKVGTITAEADSRSMNLKHLGWSSQPERVKAEAMESS